MIDVQDTTQTDQDPTLTLGQRMMRNRGADDTDAPVKQPASSVGTPSAGATPNTAEPHQQTAAAAADTAAQSPSSSSSKPSIGQRMIGASSSDSPTAGIKAYNNDGSPAETTTGTDAAGKPTISIAPQTASAAAPAVTSGAPSTAPATPVSGAPATTIGQRLMNLKPPPAAPQLDPNYSATQQSVRNDSVVTPKTDAQGKTLQQYKPGFGTRLLRAVSDFTQGGLGGVLNGAINPKAPGFYGKGAVNNQYTKDEINRQNRLGADKASVASMDDEYSQKEKGYGHELTSYNDEARAAGKADADEIRNTYNNKIMDERTAHNQTEETLRQQLQDAKDPATKLKAESDARAAIGKQLGLQGEALQRYSLYGDKSAMDDVNAAKAQNAEDRVGIMRDRTAIDKEKADTAAAKNSATFKDAPSIDKYSDQWYLKQRDQVRKEKGDALKNAGGDAEKAQGDYAEIEAAYKQRQQEFESRKQQWYGQVKSGKPVTVQNSDTGIPEVAPASSAPASAPAGDAGIEQPIASVRTGAPAQQKPSPATGGKSISKSDVQALANKHGMKYEDAAAQFTGKGYAIQ